MTAVPRRRKGECRGMFFYEYAQNLVWVVTGLVVMGGGGSCGCADFYNNIMEVWARCMLVCLSVHVFLFVLPVAGKHALFVIWDKRGDVTTTEV